MSLLGADVQRRAAPQVAGVDPGAVRQQVLDHQVLVGGGGQLEGRLGGRGEGEPITRGGFVTVRKAQRTPAGRTCPLRSFRSRQPVAAILAASTKARARRPFATAMWRNLGGAGFHRCSISVFLLHYSSFHSSFFFF